MTAAENIRAYLSRRYAQQEIEGKHDNVVARAVTRGPEGGVNPLREVDLEVVLQARTHVRPAEPGVQAIAEARAYQLRKYSSAHDKQDGHRQQLYSAALALLTNNRDFYPFGDVSWSGISHQNGGRKAQLAHAGACIAAVLDLMQPQEQEEDFTDWSQE